MNAIRFGTPNALTGPMVRGDLQTMALHRKALSKRSANEKRAHEAAIALATALVT